METRSCPNCFDGREYQECSACEGTGVSKLASGSKCVYCRGSGEVIVGYCPVCRGRRVVPEPYVRLLEADEQVRRQSPNWSGSSLDRPGITQYSLAAWFRKRKSFGGVVRVCGWPEYGPHENVVQLWSASGNRLELYGFCWGYGGEGPTGLAIVLSDAGFFDSVKEACAFVAKQPMGKRWCLTRS